MVRDGYRFALPLFALAVIAAVVRWPLTCGVLLLATAFVVFFFRDPERLPPSDPAAVVSPADGRVMEVVSESWNGRAGRRISIFLAIWNVHVNRAPMAGRVERVEYRPGRFFGAMRSRASAENEQNVIHLETAQGKIVFKQIAGLIARRIVFRKKPGDSVAAGERVGLIKFGSRVDVLFGPEWEIVVRPGMRVAGGSSIIARRVDPGQPHGA